MTDAQTDKVIADSEFYQRAAAEGGTWSFGGADKGMLARIMTVVQQYLGKRRQSRWPWINSRFKT